MVNLSRIPSENDAVLFSSDLVSIHGVVIINQQLPDPQTVALRVPLQVPAKCGLHDGIQLLISNAPQSLGDTRQSALKIS